MLMLSQNLGSPNITCNRTPEAAGSKLAAGGFTTGRPERAAGDRYRLSDFEADEGGRTLRGGVANGCASRPDALGKTVGDAPLGGAGSTTGSLIGGAAFGGAAFAGGGEAARGSVRGGAAGEEAAAAPTATQPATGVPLLALASAAFWAMILG